MVWDRQCLEDSEQKDQLLNESVNAEGVCRTAMATQGLLIMAVGLSCNVNRIVCQQTN